MDPEKLIQELTDKLEQATKSATTLAEQLTDTASAEDVATIGAELKALKASIADLEAQRAEAEKDAEIKRLRADVDRLVSIRTERKHLYHVPNVNVGAEPETPWSVKLWRARRGDQAARAEMQELQTKALKALGEGTNTAGGYLVPPQYIQDLVMLRRASAPFLQYITSVPGIKSNMVYVPTQTGVETVAWTAENATKTSTDEVFGQIAVNIYTLAGIAKVSNQLLEDSSPAVDQIVKTSLGRGLGIELDRAVINGSGTGQPTGILNTSGVLVTAASAQTAASIFDDIFAAIGRFQAAYYGQPDVILMAPRTYTKMLTAKDSAGRFLAQSTLVGNQMLSTDGNPSQIGGANLTFSGIPLVVDANVPIAQTVGANTNRSSIVVGAGKEAWLLERDGIAMDVSSEAGTSFEQNQTWFRGEMRAGFTAARLPVAFQVVSDVGP